MSSASVAVERREIAQAWCARIRAEYLEMPGLSLTSLQAQRFWGLDAEACCRLLDTLIQSGFLRRTTQGAYVRTGRA